MLGCQPLVRKYKSIADIPHVKAANSKTLSAKVGFVRDSLADRQGGKPGTTKALDSTIAGMFPSGLDEEVRAAIIKSLVTSRFLAIDGTKVTYPSAG